MGCLLLVGQPWSAKSPLATSQCQRTWALHGDGLKWAQYEEQKFGLVQPAWLQEDHGFVSTAIVCDDFVVRKHRGAFSHFQVSMRVVLYFVTSFGKANWILICSKSLQTITFSEGIVLNMLLGQESQIMFHS